MTCSIQKAAELLDINRRTLYNWIKSNKIQYVLKNGNYRIETKHIRYLIESFGYGNKEKNQD